MALQVWDGTKYVGAELGRFGASGSLVEALVWDSAAGQYVTVWSATPVVQLTGTTSGESRDQLNQALATHGVSSDTVTTLPFLLDTSQATNLDYLFGRYSSLTSVPDMDTSQVTSMSYMFNGCSSLTAVPDLETSQATNMEGAFYGCSSLTDGNVRCIGKHPAVYTDSMIDGSGLTREPFYDTNGNPI